MSLLGIVPEYEMSDEEYTEILDHGERVLHRPDRARGRRGLRGAAEYLRPECAEGRNPWSFEAADNQELFDRWLDCIYAVTTAEGTGPRSIMPP